MTRRQWLSCALISGAGLLLASCGGDEEDEQSSRIEPSPRVGTSVETAREPEQITLALLEFPNQLNPARPSNLARELVAEWSSGSIPGAPEDTVLQTAAIPVIIDKNGVIQTTAGVIDFLSSRAAGDVAGTDLVWLSSLADTLVLFETGLFAPLDHWLNADRQRPFEAFAEEARRLVRARGQTIGLPLAVSPGVLSHNAIRFQQANVAAPTYEWTWQDFIEAGKRLTADTNDDGTPDRWGFIANWHFPDWLPFLLQEGGTIIDLDTGKIGLEDPASIRALTAWDELGKVHGIIPHGPMVSQEDLQGWTNARQSAMQFSRFFGNMVDGWSNVTPMPQGSRKATPLSLEEVLTIPAATSGDSAYEVLVPLAHWIGERRVLPAVTAGWQFIQQPDTDHFDLIFPEPIQETALQGLANAKASHAASSSSISYHLFHQVTLPLARGEVVVEQAIDQATNWLRNYLTQ